MALRPLMMDGVPIAPWIKPRLSWARRQGWQGHVVSGYRSRERQARLYAEWQAGKRAGPVARPGTSNHEGLEFPRGAVDVTDWQTLARLMQRWPGTGAPLRWYGPGDPVHFSATGR